MNRARHAMSRARLCTSRRPHATALCGDMLTIYHTIPTRSVIPTINQIFRHIWLRIDMLKHVNHSTAVVKLISFVFRHDNTVRPLQRWRGASSSGHAVGRRNAGRRLPTHAAPEPRRALTAARAPARVACAFALPPCSTAPRPHRRCRGRRPATRSTTGTATSATTTAAAAATATNFSRTHASGATAPESIPATASLTGSLGPHAVLRAAAGSAAAVHAVLQRGATSEPHARHGRLPAALPKTERWCAVPGRPPRPVRRARPPSLARHSAA